MEGIISTYVVDSPRYCIKSLDLSLIIFHLVYLTNMGFIYNYWRNVATLVMLTSLLGKKGKLETGQNSYQALREIRKQNR